MPTLKCPRCGSTISGTELCFTKFGFQGRGVVKGPPTVSNPACPLNHQVKDMDLIDKSGILILDDKIFIDGYDVASVAKSLNGVIDEMMAMATQIIATLKKVGDELPEVIDKISNNTREMTALLKRIDNLRVWEIDFSDLTRCGGKPQTPQPPQVSDVQ